MPILDETRSVAKLGAGQQKYGLGMSIAEGSATLDPGDELHGERRGCEVCIQEQRRREGCGGKKRGGDALHALAKEGKAIGGKRQTDRVGVAAEASEEFGGETVVVQVSGCDGVEEVEACDGSPGAMRFAFLVSEYQCRSTRPIDDPRGEDTENTTVPVRMIEDEAFGGIGALVVQQREQVLFDGGEGLAFGGAASFIELVEFGGKLLGTLRRLREEEFDDVVGNIHTACGVDARSEAKSDV